MDGGSADCLVAVSNPLHTSTSFLFPIVLYRYAVLISRINVFTFHRIAVHLFETILLSIEKDYFPGIHRTCVLC